jgi:predicted nuclease of predicted toxin-antitoxin system
MLTCRVGCAVLAQHGHDAVHTLDLPEKNETEDRIINQISLADQRVVISKDTDFFYSHLLQAVRGSWCWSRRGTFPHAICAP